MASASTSSGSQAPAAASSAVASVPSKPVELLTTADGDVVGVTISPAMQLYTMVDRFVGMSRLMALPIADRYALAGKVAAVPEEHARLVERLASNVATSVNEVNALNALYFLELCQELVPGFKDAIPEGRIQKAAELSPHGKVQAAVLLGEKPPEWAAALKRQTPNTVMLLPQNEEEELEDKGIVYDAGRMIGDGAKLVGGAALGGVGLISDTLGITKHGEDTMVEVAEEAVDVVGDSANLVVDTVGEGANFVVDTLDEGIGGTADDLQRKGLTGAVGDGVADAADMLQDFVGDAVHGIAGGVRSVLDFVANDGQTTKAANVPETHKVAIVVGELFGEERSLGLRIESRLITKFTKPEAEKLGWKLGDCIAGVGERLVTSQDDMLAAIGVGKEALKTSGTPLRFLVERMGKRPEAGQKRGDLVFVGGRPARVQEVDPRTGVMTVQYQDDGSMARVAGTN